MKKTILNYTHKNLAINILSRPSLLPAVVMRVISLNPSPAEDDLNMQLESYCFFFNFRIKFNVLLAYQFDYLKYLNL